MANRKSKTGHSTVAFRVFFSKNEFRKGREVRPSHATVGGLFQTGNKNTH